MKTNRIAVIIDGSNLYATGKGLGFDIDYKALRDILRAQGDVVAMNYYTAIIDDSDDFNPLRPLLDWMAYNGFSVRTKLAKSYQQSDGTRRIKGNMDAEMIVDSMELITSGNIDRLILLSGDGDFAAMIRAAQRRGIPVDVISSIKTQPQMASDDIRRAATKFIDLDTLREKVARPPRTED